MSEDPQALSVTQLIDRVEKTLSKSIKKIPEQTAVQLAADPNFMSNLVGLLKSSGTLDTIVNRVNLMTNDDPATPSPPDDAQQPENMATAEPQLPPATSPNDYHVDLLPDNAPSLLAAARYDSTHQLMPNRIVVYVLVENTQTHMTYWQINVNPDPFCVMAIEAALADTPSNVHRRCQISRVKPATDTAGA